MTKRPDGRKPDELRKTILRRNYLRHAEGSVMIETGHTRVICSATIEDRVPSFQREAGGGWVTAEYGMIPRSSATRIRREIGSRGLRGRTFEIQRLIGRSLRAVTDLKRLGSRTITIDCDVVQADGGTRTASITGAYVALADAVGFLQRRSVLEESPLVDTVAAVSVGVLDGEALLDLCYVEDVRAEVDMNVVMTGRGKYIEVQGTAEGEPFTGTALNRMLRLAKLGVDGLTAVQNEALGRGADR
ncbi:MAG: ribonuclease PH [Candidatus Eisenbacteria bacterium]